MKKIGEGLQYEVFEVDGNNKRVRKIPLSNEKIAKKITAWLNRNSELDTKPTFLFEEKFNSTLDERFNSYMHIKQLVEDFPSVQNILGNLEFLDNYTIEQDRATILGDYLNDTTQDIEFQKQIIDQFIELIFECWKYGFSDRVFNMSENTGLDSNNTMIQIDTGEIVYEQEKVKELIEIKRWEKSWSFTKDLKIDGIKEYYAQKMEGHITIENLEKYWRSRI